MNVHKLKKPVWPAPGKRVAAPQCPPPQPLTWVTMILICNLTEYQIILVHCVESKANSFEGSFWLQCHL